MSGVRYTQSITDEEYARRLQAREALRSADLRAALRAATAIPSSQQPQELQDEELARVLQAEENNLVSTGEAFQEVPNLDAEANLQTARDEELARELQAQEDSRSRGEVPPRGRPMLSSARRRLGNMSYACCVRSAIEVSNTGAMSGCCCAVQIAYCFSFSCANTAFCALVGAILGQVASWRSGGGTPFRRRRGDFDEFSSSSEDDSELEQRGLDPDSIEGFTVGHLYTAPAAQASGSAPSATNMADDQGKCMVCMEFFETGERVRTLPCLHRYHQQCIDDWLARSTECPICKRDITDTQCTPELSGRGSGARSRVLSFGWVRRPWRRRSRDPTQQD